MMYTSMNAGDHQQQQMVNLKAPTGMLHQNTSALENTYYNQTAVSLHSQHVNSTLPRYTKHPSSAAKHSVGSNNHPFAVPPPPNYPPPSVNANEENYENVDAVKLSNKYQHQTHQSPSKKNSTSSTASSSLVEHQLTPVQSAMSEQAQRVRLNPSQSNSAISLQQGPQQNNRATAPPLPQDSKPPSKSRMGVSSFTKFGGKPTKSCQSPISNPSQIYDAADQHYNTAPIEPHKAVSRAATRTPTSEVSSHAIFANTQMPAQYANSDAIIEGATAKSPSSVPVQITPDSKIFTGRSHTPTSNNEQRQTSSQGDMMTLANPIYDVYNADPDPPRQICYEQPAEAFKRSDSVRLEITHVLAP